MAVVRSDGDEGGVRPRGWDDSANDEEVLDATIQNFCLRTLYQNLLNHQSRVNWCEVLKGELHQRS